MEERKPGLKVPTDKVSPLSVGRDGPGGGAGVGAELLLLGQPDNKTRQQASATIVIGWVKRDFNVDRISDSFPLSGHQDSASLSIGLGECRLEPLWG